MAPEAEAKPRAAAKRACAGEQAGLDAAVDGAYRDQVVVTAAAACAAAAAAVRYDHRAAVHCD